MSNAKWEKLVKHAMTTALNGKFYVYYPDETRQVGAVFNSGYIFCGLIEDEQFTAIECLNDDRQKVTCLYELSKNYLIYADE